MNWKKYRTFTLDQIHSTPVCYEPFAHLWLDCVFDPGLLKELQTHWPDGDSFWIDNTKGQNTNRMQWSIPHQAGIWDELYYEILSHQEIVDCVLDKTKIPALKKLYHWNSTCLWADTDGYKISPHIDQQRILIAWQTWVISSENAKGTVLYSDKHGNNPVQLTCKANNGWIMVNDGYSWHGVPEQPPHTVRKSIMNRFMKF